VMVCVRRNVKMNDCETSTEVPDCRRVFCELQENFLLLELGEKFGSLSG
jgi:hypothetical protein